MTTTRPGGTNPVNNSTCLAHGPHTGLICTRCVVELPPRTRTPPPADGPGSAAYLIASLAATGTARRTRAVCRPPKGSP